MAQPGTISGRASTGAAACTTAIRRGRTQLPDAETGSGLLEPLAALQAAQHEPQGAGHAEPPGHLVPIFDEAGSLLRPTPCLRDRFAAAWRLQSTANRSVAPLAVPHAKRRRVRIGQRASRGRPADHLRCRTRGAPLDRRERPSPRTSSRQRRCLCHRSFYDTLESGSAMLSRDRFSALIPNLNSAAAAINIRMAATA
jgi:hypothetical protein